MKAKARSCRIAVCAGAASVKILEEKSPERPYPYALRLLKCHGAYMELHLDPVMGVSASQTAQLVQLLLQPETFTGPFFVTRPESSKSKEENGRRMYTANLNIVNRTLQR